LFEKIDNSTLPKSPSGQAAVDDFHEGGIHECGIGNIIFSHVYAYNTSVFDSDTPSTIVDFFNTVKFPGKRGLFRSAHFNLEWALLADGIPKENVYETLSTTQGLNRAFNKLNTIKDDIIWWNSGSEPIDMLKNNEVVMASAWNGRVFNAQVADNEEISTVWDGQIFEMEYWSILKGTPNLNNALEYINFASESQNQSYN